MSEMAARWRYSWLFALKVGGVVGVVLALVTDLFFALAPIGMWLFLIALTVLMVTGMVSALQPTTPPVEERGIWFAPFGLTLLVFCIVMMVGYIASESAEGGMGFLANSLPGVSAFHSAIGLQARGG